MGYKFDNIRIKPLVAPPPTPCLQVGDGKGKVHPRTDHEGPEGEKRYSFTFSLTSALDGVVGGQRHAPAVLPPGMNLFPLYRRLRGPRGRSGEVQKISPPPRFDPRAST